MTVPLILCSNSASGAKCWRGGTKARPGKRGGIGREGVFKILFSFLSYSNLIGDLSVVLLF